MARSRQDWERIVAEYRRSGATQAAFAERRGVALSTLQDWMRKLRREPRDARISGRPVRVTAPGATAVVEARIDGIAFRFEVGTSAEYVAALLRAVAAPC